MGTTTVKGLEKRENVKLVKPVKRRGPRKIRAMVRVANTDLDGDKPLVRALTGIKGVSHAMSNAVCSVSRFDPNTKLKSLKESDIRKLENIIHNPIKFGIPSFLVNRRRDIETGKDLHSAAVNLEMTQKFDVQRMINIKSYKGVRHMLGLPVRGQRTRSSFRKGRSVGVVRKAARDAMKKAEKEKK